MSSDDDDNEEEAPKNKKGYQQDIIELLSDDDVEEDHGKQRTLNEQPLKKSKPVRKQRKISSKLASDKPRALQAGLVLEEDIGSLLAPNNNSYAVDESGSGGRVGTLESYFREEEESKVKTVAQHQQGRKQAVALYHDADFESAPASIEGTSRANKAEKCRCSPARPVALSYITKGPNKGRPYHCCSKSSTLKCRYFRWAFHAERMHWYRFGRHTGHVMVRDAGFTANDLLQGKVGDCWFLSALAVIAERPDLIMRLFDNDTSALNNPYGIVRVNLFIDGFWKTVILDNFLPCIINHNAESELQQALNASLGLPTTTTTNAIQKHDAQHASSKYDPFALSDRNRQVLADTQNLLQENQKRPINPYAKKAPSSVACRNYSNPAPSASTIPSKLNRLVTTEDLAYSKAKKQQLWVPFLEKAYAKSHGCYQAISGGHIAEAFLDLTGAPTLVYNLHNENGFDPKVFWYKLLSYRHQQLPMGCGTSSSAVGIIGMHAYSILDVREIRDVGMGFFRDKLNDRTLGNVSGFTNFDGTVRLLRIRNPHGQGEWQGEFSDKSDVWEKLLHHKQHDSMGSPGLSSLERTMKNDGTFWIDYDSFLLAFSNVDVVLAFKGNHAKSFTSHFPEKKSNDRCTRAFEVSLLDIQPGVPSRDTVELYVMGIQKTRRGASHGRTDRKVSYKLSDMGILVGEGDEECIHAASRDKRHQEGDGADTENDLEFDSVEGEMFGLRRNGHSRLILNRKKNKRVVIMPVSFGHPAATDRERSFVLRFVADAPLLIRELPITPRIDRVLHAYCFGKPRIGMNQRKTTVLLKDASGIQKYGEPLYRVFQIDFLANSGGIVFVYLCVNDRIIKQKCIGRDDLVLDLSIEATCRGMMCRTESGFLTHETLAKGKKFEASWRKFSCDFHFESRTRLLMVLVQSGQDSEMGSITCTEKSPLGGQKKQGKKQADVTLPSALSSNNDFMSKKVDYEKFGVFKGNDFVSMRHAAIFGQGAAMSGMPNNNLSLDVFDCELERALALSRGDKEMKEALDLNKQNAGTFSPSFNQIREMALTEDQEMILAMEKSKAEVSGSSKERVALINVDYDLQHTMIPSSGPAFASTDLSTKLFNDDLKEAIKRSIQEATNSSSILSGTKMEVIGLDTTVNNHSTKKKNPKRQKTDQDVIEMIDDEEEGAKHDRNSSVSQLAEKRSLAAKAAEIRSATCQGRKS